MAVSVRYQEIQLAFDFVSAGQPFEHNAYISLDTGQVFWVSDLLDEDEAPPDLETSDRYLEIPHKNELDLGKNLVQRFVASRLPEDAEEVESIFSRRGAYSRFKGLLESKGLLEEWYEYEADQCERTLREWCADNGIDLIEEKDV